MVAIYFVILLPNSYFVWDPRSDNFAWRIRSVSEFDALLALLRTATLAAVPSTRRCLASCSAAPAFQFFASEMSNRPARENFQSLDLTPLPSLKLVAFHGRQKGNHLHASRKSLCDDSFSKGSIIMKISLRLFGCAVGFAALAVTGALAQSPASPAAFSFQFVSQFDYPGTGNQTRPQKINDLGDIAGLFVNTAAASFGFMRLNNGNFSR